MSTFDPQDINERTLPKALRHQAATIGDDDFLVYETERYTYAEANATTNAWARELAGLGLAAHEAICLFAKGGSAVSLLSFAANKLGAFFVPVNTDLRGELLADHLKRSNAKLLYLDAKLAAHIEPIWPQLDFTTVIVKGALEAELPGAELVPIEQLDNAADVGEPAADPKFSDLASVMWSSGTTGSSKGIMQSHHLWIYSAIAFNAARRIAEGDVLYSCLPVYNGGTWVLGPYGALVCGGSCASDELFSVSRFWDRIRRYGARHTATLATMHMYLWQQPETDRDADNPLVGWYALPVPADLEEPFRRRFGIEYLLQSGGQSECMGWSFTDPTGRRGTPGSAGFPRDDVEIRIVDDNGVEVPPGTPGEACVRSKVPYAVFSGYYRDPQRTVDAWRDLWHHSGDIYKVNEDGELFFVDRKADYIRYKGRNISSFDAEKAIERHPAVSEAAVIGIPTIELASESELAAFIVLKDEQDVEPETIARFVNDTSAHFLVPRYITFADELPQTPTGRVQKHRLREAGVAPETWDAVSSGFTARR